MNSTLKISLPGIDESALEGFRNWFRGFLRRFEGVTKDPIRDGVRLKAIHTIRVCAEIRRIGQELGLPSGPMRLATATALFHDVGRFEQYTRHGAFLDRETVNHAALGVEVLEKHGILSRLQPAEADVLRKSVLYHNRKEIPADETDERVLFFSRLVRDADKLDIWHILTAYYTRPPRHRVDAIDLNLPSDPIFSPEVLADITAGRSVDEAFMRTQGDFKLMQIAWVYDLNYVPSFHRLGKKQYLEKIRATLPPSPIVDEILMRAIEYRDRKIKGKQNHKLGGVRA